MQMQTMSLNDWTAFTFILYKFCIPLLIPIRKLIYFLYICFKCFDLMFLSNSHFSEGKPKYSQDCLIPNSLFSHVVIRSYDIWYVMLNYGSFPVFVY